MGHACTPRALITGRTTAREQRPKPVRSLMVAAFLGSMGSWIVAFMRIRLSDRMGCGASGIYCNQSDRILQDGEAGNHGKHCMHMRQETMTNIVCTGDGKFKKLYIDK